MADVETTKRIDNLEKLTEIMYREQATFQTAINEQMKALTENVCRIERVVDCNASSLNQLIAKTTNGWGDTLKRHEKELQGKVDHDELNGAINSVRNEVKTLKWIFGLSFPPTLAALATLVFKSFPIS